jgi:hypothetical protein
MGKPTRAAVAPSRARLARVKNLTLKTKTGSPELQRAMFLWEHKAAEIAEECQKFLAHWAKLKKAERGGDRYFAETSELSVIGSVLEAKGQSLSEIDDQLIDALPED